MTDPATPAPGQVPAPPRPEYKGTELDPARGPGLGCFRLQVALLVLVVVLTPIGVANHWPIEVTGTLLVVSIVLLFFAGQTVIFLLRLVAAERGTRRRPLAPGSSRTVGELEDEAEAHAGEPSPGAEGAGSGPPAVRQ